MLCACPGRKKRPPSVSTSVVKQSASRRNPIGGRSRESAVLTFNPAKTSHAAKDSLGARRLACAIGALALTFAAMTSAHAGTLWVGGCTGSAGAANCVLRETSPGDPYVRLVPKPESDEDKAQLAERDRKWLARCRPVIEQDRYGVPRYLYAARGCEFGVIE
jgi:hypothetical protein